MSSPVTIRRVDAHPEIAALWQRLQEIRAEEQTLKEQANELLGRGARNAEAAKEREAQVEAVIAGRPLPDHHDTSRASALADIHRRRALLREAEAVAKSRMAAIRASESRQIAEEVLPAYRANVEARARLLVELGAIEQEEAAFQEALHDGGVAFASTIRPMPFPDVRLEPGSTAARWLDEAAEYYGIRVPAWENLKAERQRQEEQARVEEGQRRQEQTRRAEEERKARIARARESKGAKRSRWIGGTP